MSFLSNNTIWTTLAVFGGLLTMYNLGFVFFYERLLFQDETLETDFPVDFDFQYEEVTLNPDVDVQLHGLLLKADQSRGLVLYFHGNRGNVSRWGMVADKVRNFGYDVLIMDYRGYGKSMGARSEAALYQDARFIYDHAIEQMGYENIVIYGRSLGSAVATHLATKRRARHLILETPLTRIREVIPLLDFLLIYKPWMKYEFNSADRIDEIECPITILHGTDDKVVPYKMGEMLYADINHSNKKLITIQGGKHNNLDTFENYQQAIGRILK